MSRNFSVTTGRDGRRTFGEHDDRWNDSGGGRGGGYGGNRGYQKYKGGKRGGFKNTGGRGSGRGFRRGSGKPYRGNNRGRGGPGPHSRFDSEGDFSMNDNDGPSTSNSRYSPYGRPNRGPRPSSSHDSNSSGKDYNKMQRMGLPVDGGQSYSDQWFRVMIPKGRKGGKEFILQSINEKMDTPFQPINFHFEQDKAVFYVQDRHESNAIKYLDKRITMPNGFKMVIIVRPSMPPVFHMDDESIEKLKLCMSKRYDPATKALNLSCLAKDQDLSAANLFLALSRPNVMSNVIKIIGENIPELEALDISDNKILSLDYMTSLTQKAVNITKLNMGKNKIRDLQELEKIKKWKLEELILDGNDLCDKFKDQNSYISAIRKKFPKMIKLDGHDLPPPIKFDLEASAELPQRKESYFVNDDIQQVVVQFLKQYFTFYDSDNRQPLQEAYHDQALFSLSTSYNPVIEYNQPKLTDYISESRNLLRMGRDSTGVRINKVLKKGKLNVVSQLCLLPKTTHDYNSFVVDVDHASPSLLSFSVEGVFKEADSKSDTPPVRAFSRRFVALPSGPGMILVNDMLTLTNASREQFQGAFKHPAPTPSSSPVPDASPAAPFPQPGVSYTQEQQQMIQQFSVQSSMNHEWSTKCLEQNSWNYEKAGENFLELQKQNKIPQEAFIK